ncbi:hypothetical protein Htur_5026 (plasmid) [Haloterrigena turkmenica DSM 5511]|uniref:Uncharacterized protein n=1 Tax=Haloterrigena turkmenica (strain ATCC 51198 / DSM 5511 / JCM 9101 / NCIMB 13204 / VKM B-1734 / 4k) TaxID=543526 RepID=D2S3G7_HALTV|nr:hypothetical protein [Haloterrigena turkmenica]ADB63914.1 hypothetical protein Htur_5026 [Haloterrigena turkmenica DSM 5511]
MTQKSQTRRQYLQRTGGAALTVTGASALATTSASAQSDSQQGILADGVGEGGNFRAFLEGKLSGVSVGGPSESAEVYADRMRNEFNANSEHWINYGNWLIDEYDVQAAGDTVVGVDVQVSKFLRGDDVVSTTVDVGYDSETDQLTSLEWRLGAPEEPDYEVVLIDDAAENGADELADLRREFIDTSGEGDHSVPSEEYVSRHVGQYSSFIDLGNDGQTVFEMLLGEVKQ